MIEAPIRAESFQAVGIGAWIRHRRSGTMSRVPRPRAWLTLLAFVLGFVLTLGAFAPGADAQPFRPRGRSAALIKVAPRKATPPAAAPAKTPTRTAVTAPSTAPRKTPAATPARPAVAKKAPPRKKAKSGDDDEDVVVVDDDEDEDE